MQLQPDHPLRLHDLTQVWLLYAHPTRREARDVYTDPLDRLHGPQAPPGARYMPVFLEEGSAVPYAVALRGVGIMAYAAACDRGALAHLLNQLRAGGCGVVIFDPQLRGGQPDYGNPAADVLAALAG